jgi:hypothetical protein
MKIGKWILTIWLAASAWAQTPVPKPQATPPSVAKPSGAQAKAGAPRLAASVESHKLPSLVTSKAASPAAVKASNLTVVKAANPAAANVISEKAKAAQKPSAQSSMPASAATVQRGKRKPAQLPSANGTLAEAKPGRKGRDPFVSPIVERIRTGAACTGAGKRCLYVGDLSLLGIVQSPNGIIAVVASGERTYFLREHDPLADGDVERITKDAITMRQRSSDVLGRPQVHEVTRKLGPAV